MWVRQEVEEWPSTSECSFDVPKRFGCYEYVRTIGKGSNSVIILVKNIKTGVEMACKFFLRQQVMESGNLPLLEKELRIMERLKHPGIIRIEKILYLESFIAIVMEYCQNGTLYDYIVSNHVLPNWEVKKITRDILKAISYLHNHGIVHRDIKLDNIVLSDNFEPKLIDFGLCTETINGNEMRRTICGTLEYIAPEVLCKKEYDPKAVDIWALGICMYTMAAGQFPWFGSASNIVNGIKSCNIQYTPNIHHTTRQMIQLMLDPDNSKRPCADELIKLIDEINAATAPKMNSLISRKSHKYAVMKPFRASLNSNKFNLRIRSNGIDI